MKGYVIFNTQEEFDLLHEAEKLALGYPIVGEVNGVPRPDKQQSISITVATKHPTDNRVIAFINGGWREETKGGFTFLTKDQAKEEGWFPEVLPWI